MEIFDVFSMNGIENYPAAGENFLENVILKVSDTLSQGFISQGGGGHTFFKGGQCPPPPPLGGGGCEVPCEGARLSLPDSMEGL